MFIKTFWKDVVLAVVFAAVIMYGIVFFGAKPAEGQELTCPDKTMNEFIEHNSHDFKIGRIFDSDVDLVKEYVKKNYGVDLVEEKIIIFEYVGDIDGPPYYTYSGVDANDCHTGWGQMPESAYKDLLVISEGKGV